MKIKFDKYFKSLFLILVAVFSTYTATSQCDAVIKTSPALLQGCEDFSVQFFDSTLTDPSVCIIQRRRWNFGDGTAFTGTENPVHVYSAGVNGDTTYTAWLAIQDQFNAWDSTSVNITVFKKPFAEFTLSKDTVCAFNETFCTNNLSQQGAGYSYRWDFETGISSSYDTCYVFVAEGDYTVRLSVTDNQGCISSYEQPIAVNEIPNPDFSITPFSGCHPIDAAFSNTTPSGTFPITQWAWDFDGYGNSSLRDPGNINFPDPGLYEISLSATNSAGCFNTTKNNFLVRETPTASINFNAEACVDENVTFTYDGSGTPAADFKWTFVNAVKTSEVGGGPILNSWASGGEYEVALSVTENACSDTVRETILINDLPVVDLSSDAPGDSVCELETITFTAAPASFVTYEFQNFGTTLQNSALNTFSIDTLKSPNEISVIATDSNNCASTASSSLEITVLPKPFTAIFSSDANDTICFGESVTFNASGNYDQYDFYDGFLGLSSSSSSVYTTDKLEPDNEIYAIATDLGCVGFPSNRISTTVVDPLAKPQLNCGESTTNSVSWKWDAVDDALGYEVSIDGGAFETPNFGLGHFKPGMFFGDSAKAVVFAVGEDPCGNSIVSDTVTCYAIPCEDIGFIPASIPNYCAGDTVVLSVNNIDTKGAFELTYNDSIINDSTISFIGAVDTSITIELTDFAQPGCPQFSYEYDVVVNPIPEFDFLISADTVCKNEEIIASSDTAGYGNYQFFVDGVLVQDSAYHILNTSFNQELNKRMVLRALEKGCTYSDTTELFVVPTPPNVLSLSSDSLCQNGVVTFSGTPGYVRYEFSQYDQLSSTFNTLLDSTTNTLDVYAEGVDNVIVSLVAYDENGCSSIETKDTAFVTPLPEVVIDLNKDSLCVGEIARISSDVKTYDDYKLFENFFLVGSNDSGNFVIPNPIDDRAYWVQPTFRNCVGPLSNQVKISVSEPLDVPQTNCGTTGNGTINFTWDPITGAEGYDGILKTTSGGVSNISTNIASYEINGLSAGDTAWLEVQAKSSSPCGPSLFSVQTYCIMPCAGVDFSLDNYPDRICEGDSLILSIGGHNRTLDNRVVKWQSFAVGKTDSATYKLGKGFKNISVAVSDTTQPQCPATIKYFNFEVVEVPVVTLSGPSEICKDTIVKYVATPRNYDSYAFYDGYVKIQDTINPEVIDLVPENGHFYRVVATNKGCVDTSNSIEISVVDPLEIPDAFCGASGLDSVDLRWDSVPNANGYQISINGFPWSTPNGDFVHAIKGMSPEDSVSFEVRALGGLPCGPGLRSQKVYCVAKPCHYKDFTFPSDTTICEGDSIDIIPTKIISISNQRGFSYNFGATFSASPVRRIGPKNDAKYWLRMIDSTELQCPFVEKTIEVNVHPLPIFNLSNSTDNDTVCEGEIIIFTADTAGFDVYQTYINNILVLDTNYFEFRTDSLGNGIQKIYMTAYDDVCSFASDTQEINVVSFPELTLTSSDIDLEICEEDTVAFSANAGFEEYNFYQIFNSDTTLLRSGTDSAFVTNALINSSTIYVEGVNSNTCSKTTANFDFTVFPIPKPELTSSDIDNSICRLDTIIFTVSPDTFDIYQFYDNDKLVDFGGHIYTTDSLKSGNAISVIATDDGCSNTSDTIFTSVNFTPTMDTSLDTNEICLGDELKLWAQGGTTKKWSTGETTDTITVSPAVNEVFWVTGTTGTCTSPRDTFVIDIDDNIPTPYAGADTTICINDSLQLFASGGTTYKWFPEDSVDNYLSAQTFAFPLSTQYIKLQAKNKHCIREDSLLLTIDLCLTELPDKIPNGFTPNGDGVNDTWDVPSIWYFKNNSVQIYNRWSNKVYDKNYYTGDWAGTNKNGNPLPDGTYFYVLDLGNGRAPYTGFIIIHR